MFPYTVFILQQVKLSLDDPDSSLSSWNSNDDSPCRWSGVSCAGDFSSVTSVDLSSANLAGPFPSVICRLSNLAHLSLYNNSINSTLPLNIAACKSLQTLDLSQNLLTGELPQTLADIPSLVHLDLTGNNFSGDIPASFGKFENLEVLSLVYNLLDGTIPPFLGNISSLKMLNLSYNPFSPSRIPPELGNLTNLEVMWLTECHLVGQIPDSLGQLSKLVDLDLALNDLIGHIPPSLGGLTNVVQIELYNNSLTGEIPPELGNLKSLRLLDASMNQLTGKIPDELCRVPLESLNLYENNLEGELPASIALSPNLYELRIFGNRLTGELPKDLGKNSPLRWLDVSENEFSGELPADLCAKGELEELLIIHNSFSGAIPESFSDCKSLTRIRLAYNRFSGSVPTGFWGLPHVNLLELVNNSFSGEISKSIGGASNLSLLILSNNEFTGSLPEEIGSLDNLNQLSASGNKFSGSLPDSLMKLGELGTLDLHGNQFSGELTPGIKSWKKLNELNLADNEFSGKIPDEIGSLSVLNYLDLSGNMFLWQNPGFFAEFEAKPAESVGLCGSESEAKKRGYVWLLRSIFVLAAMVFVAGVAWFYFKYRTFKKARAMERSKWTLMSFHKLGFSEHEILESLDEDNVIGAGASGKVYKVVLTNGETVAVKRLWTGSVKETGDCDPEKGNKPGVQDEAFEAEVETLGKIRHKNIVKLWCCCSTRDCKLLVYEYMPNGSLGDLLHSSKGGMLGWQTRFKIILDAAEGLSYLHHDCVPPIVHRDIKSNNILIDGDYGARVADFGVAKAVDLTGKAPKSMSVIAGSCGYIAPEYAYTLRVNEKSDIYSFGVVILEIVTRKRPVDPELGEKDLVKWVCTTLDQKGIDHVIDPKLDSCFKDEISKILNVGLLCTSPLPINRPSMRRVVKMLQEIGGGDEDSLHKTRDDKDGKLTPYYNEETSDQGSVA
ncbi:unnamed protein product [Arabidopsis arenosa]|uniref:non-specific serine/threonine protein kinase n=1 Tax=Arabidopsis arenosa TaxID=38785 RepID=A0A8S1ZJ22_ARAAE|nr:unnamed protein product [Arabidopsis arenosa]